MQALAIFVLSNIRCLILDYHAWIRHFHCSTLRQRLFARGPSFILPMFADHAPIWKYLREPWSTSSTRKRRRFDNASGFSRHKNRHCWANFIYSDLKSNRNSWAFDLWKLKTFGAKTDLQSLIDSLQFAANCVPAALSFTWRLIKLLSSFQKIFSGWPQPRLLRWYSMVVRISCRVEW